MAQRTTLERLPSELLDAILSAMPDIATLEAAVMTGPRLFNVFKESESAIIERVLTGQIGAEVLHEALTAHLSGQKKDWCNEEAKGFLDKYFTREKPSKWSLSQARPLSRFHPTIEYFSNKFISESFQVLPLFLSERLVFAPARSLSRAEENRITRGFYRFQTIRNLFVRGNENLPSLNDLEYVYFKHFAPWENEQLVCIYHFLMGIIKPVLDEVILWSSGPLHELAYEDGMFQNCSEYHLTLGLPHIQRLIEANTLPAQQGLVELWPHRFTQFLDYRLSRTITLELQNRVGIDMTYKPFYCDPDSGPEDIWHWAYFGQWPRQSSFHLEEPIRQCPFVMWDRWRIDELDLLDDPWTSNYNEDGYKQEKERQHAQRRLKFDSHTPHET
ncbi:hypothetical protein BO78DRAFT_390740 [Aspergillus sclerotiicarbonarius CBS 121057]|uniref:F-box domain-containing protein n=1 Tax=Aspergillus sclerotiicarbonarius (strain CBS 121057 / IBT 28362) TaxID=1448318 RepID=A0A319DVU0_ASPSB|nr:hypothetical protein BO78DRAFT_390740 [Aspergillus sclerotiicarbonarius CBS 121057]